MRRRILRDIEGSTNSTNPASRTKGKVNFVNLMCYPALIALTFYFWILLIVLYDVVSSCSNGWFHHHLFFRFVARR